MIHETTIRRDDGTIETAAIDDGAGCYVFLREVNNAVVVTQQFEEGGKYLGTIKLTRQAAVRLAPLFAEIAAREQGQP